MLIATITGNIVTTVKHPDYQNHKLFIVRAVDLEGKEYGPEVVCVDGCETPAGVGDYVLVDEEGGGARDLACIDHTGPVEHTVAAVIDYINTNQGGFSQFAREE